MNCNVAEGFLLNCIHEILLKIHS